MVQSPLEDAISAVSPSACRPFLTCCSLFRVQVFKFLQLPEKNGDLTAVATEAIAELGLRAKVLNRNLPAWVPPSVAANSTLHASLRRLRGHLDYAGKAGWFSVGGSSGTASMRR